MSASIPTNNRTTLRAGRASPSPAPAMHVQPAAFGTSSRVSPATSIAIGVAHFCRSLIKLASKPGLVSSRLFVGMASPVSPWRSRRLGHRAQAQAATGTYRLLSNIPIGVSRHGR